jgi:hypothetical protein
MRPDEAGHLLCPIQPDISGLDEIADVSHDEYSVEELVFIEECAELQEGLTSD